MRVYSKGGPLTFDWFAFPDGQMHCKLLLDSEFREATIETRIRNAEELFAALLVNDVLQQKGYTVNLDIRYLLGARMDRRINVDQPFTLAVVARLINQAGFAKVRILDPHSGVSLDLICKAHAVLPVRPLAAVLAHYTPETAVIVAPDAGAAQRTETLLRKATRKPFTIVQALKHRDPQTGILSGFSLVDSSIVKDRKALIVDDICDGGGTFAGVAELLKAYGATSVDLFVTHGIFSKGLPIKHVDQVFTTDSYNSILEYPKGAIVIRVRMDEIEQLA